MTRKWRIEEGWATLLLLTAMLLSVVWAVRAAEWTDGLGILQWVALMALLVSLVVTQLRRFPALLAWPLLLVAGVLAGVIAAAGVWTEQTQDLAEAEGGLKVLASKGIHIVVPKERLNGNDVGFILQTEKSVLFIIPWERYWVIGTTDTPYEQDYTHPVASQADIDKTKAEIARLEEDLATLQSDMEAEMSEATDEWTQAAEQIEEVKVTPRKSDIDVHLVTLA